MPPTQECPKEPVSLSAPTDSKRQPDPGQVRWNLAVLVLDVSFFSIGMAFLDLSAVLPLLLERLGATRTIIGLFAALRFLAFSAVQIYVAYGMHGRERQKPLLAFVATVTRLPLLVLPLILWRAADSPAARTFALWATIGILAFWALGDGLGYVPWMEIVARAFSDRTRGRFFATTQLISGVVSIGVAALIVRTVLNSTRLPFPQNYAVLAGLAALMYQISLIGVLLIREPPAPLILPTARPPLTDYFRRLPILIRENPIFGRLALVQLLVGFGSASAPFYVLYAKQRFHLSDAWGGTFQVLSAIGVVVLMPAWAWLGERRGPATSVRGVALACLLTPLVALTLGGISPWLFGLVFLLMGGSLGWGMWIAMNHFLLTHISEDERPLFVALLNLLFAPSALYPYLGGLLVEHLPQGTGLPFLFGLTIAVVAVGLLLALRLPAPDTAS